MSVSQEDVTRPPACSLVEVHDLHTHFVTKRAFMGSPTHVIRAVDGVTFQVPRGSTLGIVGESGCGKSTLARTILRLTPSTSGRVIFDGISILDLSSSRM